MQTQKAWHSALMDSRVLCSSIVGENYSETCLFSTSKGTQNHYLLLSEVFTVRVG